VPRLFQEVITRGEMLSLRSSLVEDEQTFKLVEWFDFNTTFGKLFLACSSQTAFPNSPEGGSWSCVARRTMKGKSSRKTKEGRGEKYSKRSSLIT